MDYKTVIGVNWINTETNKSLLLNFNEFLDKKANFALLNESSLENLIDSQDSLALVKDEMYWLTLARINELALLCAENYANNGELTLVGDLLLNPRLILIHIRGQIRPIVKERHTRLTDQFSYCAESRQGVVRWLKTETFLEIKIKALLPDLHQRLEDSGYLSKEYLDSMDKRKSRIAEWIGFLSCGHFSDSVAFNNWYRNANPADRELIESKFCRLNLEPFFELGRRIRQLGQTPAITTGFQINAFG